MSVSDGKSVLTVGDYELELSGLEGVEGWRGSLVAERVGTGVDLVRVKIESDEPGPPPAFSLMWWCPIVKVHGLWHPGSVFDKGLAVDWVPGFRSKATSLAPVACLYGLDDGRNRLTYALSDALNPVTIKAGVHEETARLRCSVSLFGEPAALAGSPASYEVMLRLDTRDDVPYHEALRDVAAWWASLPGFEPAPVPETARLPMYSTWYSFHQALDPGRVEEQCRLAKELGCEAVIVDDGWQTTSNERGYAYTGDWRPTPEKIPDMRAHVDRVHALGMEYLLWYSVPFVGRESEAYARFSDKLLGEIEGMGAGVLDPRFPEVREYLISTYETAMQEWDLDGFKLDFVDSFEPPPDHPLEYGAGRDHDSVPGAVDRLLTDVIARLRETKPDVMVEFRQSYVGPLMRKYGNMFRAADCPNDAVENRVRTLDIRLLCGNTAAYADMLMWNREEPVESAALQLLNVLFSVPQVSVLLDDLPQEHTEMLSFWLSFWREHRDVLLDGTLAPLHPESLYPVVLATTDTKQVAAVYGNAVVPHGGPVPETLLLVNGTLGERVVLELAENADVREVEVRDCRGQVVRTESVNLTRGLHAVEVPAAGLAVFKASGA